jgi:DNA-binding NarL/FixJ family response regulator
MESPSRPPNFERCELDLASDHSARYNRALFFWQAGDYERSLRLLDKIPIDRHTSESILLRARSLIRVNRLPEAKAWLLLNATRHQHEDAVGTNAMLIGTAYAQMKDFEQANTWFDVVGDLACHHTIVAECNYLRAMSRYVARDLDGAKRFAKLALRPGEDIVYARTRSLFGWIAVAECDHPRAYAEFLASLDVLDRCRAKDVHLRANIVSALAIMSAEAGIGDPALLDVETAKVRWNPSLVKHQVQALRHCGFAYEACGDSGTAMQRYAAAAEVAPGTVWAIYGFVACANLALRLGGVESAEAFTHFATSVEERIGDSVGWRGIDDEQRIALLELAHTLARMGDAERAKKYRDLYNEKTDLAALSSLHHDSRLATYKQHVDAMVLAALGGEIEAAGLLNLLQEQWALIGCTRRAAEVTRDLALVSARVVRSGTAEEPPADYPPYVSRRDVAIMQLIATGLDNVEIAEKLHIAPKTVKNRIGQIYAKYGVHDRTKLALLAKGHLIYGELTTQQA